MSIYDINGDSLQSCFDANENQCDEAYSLAGDVIYKKIDPYLPDRVLLFEDNFTGNQLNKNNWEEEIGYLRGDNFHSSQNVKVENECLVLLAKRESRSTSGWTIGSIIGCGFQSWMYGRFEAKLKTDGLIGSFGAFWGVSNSYKTTREKSTNESGEQEFLQQTEGDTGGMLWPNSGEFDVVEMIPGNTSTPPCNLWGTNGQSLGNKNFINNIDTKEWHIYAMEWTPQYIAMFVDGIEYKRWTFSSYATNIIQPYISQPMSLLLDQSANGASGETSQGVDEHKMLVDWVRVYAPLGFTEAIPVESISMPSTFDLKKGYKKYMVPSVLPITATYRHLTWSSSDENIVKCYHGMLYGINYGTAIVTAETDNGMVASCAVNVVATLT